jgi:hypothetical protein
VSLVVDEVEGGAHAITKAHESRPTQETKGINANLALPCCLLICYSDEYE